MWFVIIIFAIYLLFELIFYLTHRDPLTDNELMQLANKRKKLYVQHKYNFSNVPVAINKIFKSSINPDGQLYNVNEQLHSFPSLCFFACVDIRNNPIIHEIFCISLGDSANSG